MNKNFDYLASDTNLDGSFACAHLAAQHFTIRFDVFLPSSYNNHNTALGVLWSWHRVASPSIEIPTQIWKKSSLTNYTKLQKTSLPNFTYRFWTFYIASRTKNKLKQLYFNDAMSIFSQQSLHLPKNKQPKWRLLWSRDPWDQVSWFPLPSLGPSPQWEISCLWAKRFP